MIETALDSTKYSSSYEYHTISSYKDDPIRYDLVDNAIFSLKYNDIINFLYAMEEKISLHKEINYIRNIKVSKRYFEVYWASLFGSYKHYKVANISAGTEVIAEKNGEKQVGYYNRIYRNLNEFSASKVADEGAIRAIEKIGGKEIKGGIYNIIFDKDVFVELLENVLPAFFGINIYKKKSLFFNDIEKNIAKKELNIENVAEEGVGFFYPFDDEGINTKHYHIVKGGIFLTPIHTLESAKALSREATGNGFRTGYKTLPSSQGINITIDTSYKVKKEELLSFFKKAIFIKEGIGMHTINPISGDFSFGINGIYIENGEKAFPIKGNTISGNLKDLLNKIVAVSEEIEFLYGVLLGDMFL
jgi:PmbA protein